MSDSSDSKRKLKTRLGGEIIEVPANQAIHIAHVHWLIGINNKPIFLGYGSDVNPGQSWYVTPDGARQIAMRLLKVAEEQEEQFK